MNKKKLIKGHPFIAYTKEAYTQGEMTERSLSFLKWITGRKAALILRILTVPCAVMDNIITAQTLPETTMTISPLIILSKK